MAKPDFLKLTPVTYQNTHEYEPYLPTAFNESLTLLQKVNKVIHEMNKIGKVTNDFVNMWNDLIEWIVGEGLEDMVNDKLDEWLEDGTMDKIINQKLFGELKAKIEELFNIEHAFDIRDIQPQFLMNLGGLRNAVNQSINIHPNTSDVYTTQSDSNTPEGFYLTKMNPNGVYDGAMLFPEAGHGTSIGLDSTNSGEAPYIWFHHLATGKLVRILFQVNKAMKPVDFSGAKDYTPTSLKGKYFSVSYDSYYDYMCFRIEDGNVQVRSRVDLLNGVDKVLFSCYIPETERNEVRPMQGCVSYGQYIYYQSGSSDMGNHMKILKYDGKTGTLAYSHTVTDLLAEEGMYEFRDNFKEPEGLAYFVHPKTGKHSLLFVITSGDGNKRYHMLYAFNQRNASDHWDSVSRLGVQKYAFTHGDGRYFSFPTGITHLDAIIRPGLYYLTGGEADTVRGFPYPTQTTAWEVYVGPLSQTFTQLQKIKRLSVTRRTMEFERVRTFDRDTFTWSGDKWTVIMKGSPHQEYIEAVDWNNKMANIILAGEYYITSGQGVIFTDFDSDNAGWRLIVSSADSSDQIRQTVERNSDTAYQTKTRYVNVDTKTATPWRTIMDVRY